MANLKDVLSMRFIPERSQAGLAVLRIWTGATLFIRHGWEKQPAHWAQFMAHFPNPIGIGPHASFLVAFFSDFVCGILLVIGLGTRWAAIYCFGTSSSPGLLCIISLLSAKGQAATTVN
ncbi:MAG: DoxX family protein [Candidatus Acidiferrum sp.]